MDDMFKRIKDVMYELMQSDTVCEYEIHCDGDNEITIVTTNASKAYMLAWNRERDMNADTYCYMRPNGQRAARAVFSVVDGVARLSGVAV